MDRSRILRASVVAACGLGVVAFFSQCASPVEPGAQAPAPQPTAAPEVQVVKGPSEWEQFEKTVKPFLVENCASCHGGDLPEANLRLDSFSDEAELHAKGHTLTHALKMIRQRKMPPSDQKQPTAEELKPVVAWLDNFALKVEAEDLKNPGHVTMRRLNRTEYNNTIRDLLGIEFRPADGFPEDDAGYGFDNNGDVLTLAPVLMDKYLTAAEMSLDRAIMVKAVIPPPLKTWDAAILEGTTPKGEPIQAGAGNSNVGGNNPRGRLFPYNGELYVDHDFPATGHYVLRVRGYGTAAQGGGRGPGGRPQILFKIDDQVIEQPVNVTTDFAQTTLYGIENPIKVEAGKHRITLMFVNGATKEESDIATAQAAIAAAEAEAQAALEAEAAAANALKIAAIDAAIGIQTPAQAGQGRGGQANAGRGGRGGGRGGAPGPSPTGKPTLGVVWIEAEGPVDPSIERMPESFRKIFTVLPSETVSRQDAARQIISNFAARAYRRPVTDAEVNRLMAYWSAVETDESFEKSISLALQPVLVSPHFLYRVEGEPTAADPDGIRTLNEFELASRLSYFIWSSMPDEELIKLASEGKLRSNLESQVKRMMASPKSAALGENFAGQWLELRKMPSHLPDAKAFPDFDEPLRAAMLKETQLFFSAIVTEDRSVLEFLDADFTFVNGRLAKHYGIPNVVGDDFRRVSLAGTDRGGLITQASVLTITSYPGRTSPVLRGKWVLENLLDSAPPPPPPNVPTLEERQKKDVKLTMRQMMEEHRQNPNCITCHSAMDPIGFGLENFNAIGAWRDQDGDNEKIDATGKLPDGQAFEGPASLKKILMSRKDEFAECLVDRMMTYALGRGMEPADRPRVRLIAEELKKHDYKFSALVLEIVKNDAFQKQGMKRGD